MVDLPNTQYDTRNLSRAKTGAWPVYKRLLGYAWRYKFRLTVSILFALVVAGSLGSMIVGVGVALNLTFGGEEAVAEAVGRVQDKMGGPAGRVLGAFEVSEAMALARTEQFVRAMQRDRMFALKVVSVFLVVLAVVGGLARFFQEYIAGAIGASISVRLGEEMFENIMRMSLPFFEARQSGEMLARFTNDIFMVNRGLASVFVKLMREPIKAAVFLGAALYINAKLTLLVLLVLPAVMFIIIRVGKQVKRSVRRSLEKIASMAAVVSETLHGIMIVKGFSMEQYETGRMRTEIQKLRRYLVRMVKADAAIGPATDVLIVLGLVGFVLVAGTALERGELGLGELTQLLGFLALTLDPIRKLTSVNNMIQTSVASAERVFEFIDAKPDIVEAPDAIALPPLREQIEFRDVRFSYDGKTEVLCGVSFTVPRGEMVALVGFSGAGKSTLVKLLPRFYDVTSGAVLIDGVDIRQATFRSLRDQCSIVTQDTILFSETIRENIAFGNRAFSLDRVRQAARAANADGFIERLPQGYDTQLGEGGGGLSGGQRQRLAIARAVVKDPAILILDEATSSLDSESERAIQKAIEEFVVGRTSIVIAHRLSTIQRADRILVLDEGRVVEEGSHQELLLRNGLYRRLYDVQFGVEAQAAP
jgi:ATP-binding cassette, subfamily B, bacterial MsbA